MSTLKYILEVITSEFFDDGPSYAVLEVSQEDLDRWSTISNLVKEHTLYCAEDWDYRCDFLSCEEEPMEFRQDASRAVIDDRSVRFMGYCKHAGPESEWSTNSISLESLRAKFQEG